MTYSVGGTIQASDINGWINTMNSVYGIGTGNSGYGQTTLQDVVVTGNTITSAHWTNLRTMMSRCLTHQGTSATNLVPTSFLDSGDTIYAHIGGSGNNAYNFNTLVGAINTNRLTAASGMSLTSAAHTLTKSATWTTTTQCVITASFTSEDHARYFFNTGGELRIRLAATSSLLSSSTAQSLDWKDIITNKVGTVTLRGNACSRTGTAGVLLNSGNSGFYNLTTSAQGLFTGTNIGGGAYSSSDLNITADVTGVAGVRGGNGTAIRFTITCADEYSGVGDSVPAGLTAYIDHYKVGTTNLPIAIAAPTFTTTTAWT